MDEKMDFDSNLRKIKRSKTKIKKSKSKVGSSVARENWGTVVRHPVPVTELPGCREPTEPPAHSQEVPCVALTALSQMGFPSEGPSTDLQSKLNKDCCILAPLAEWLQWGSGAGGTNKEWNTGKILFSLISNPYFDSKTRKLLLH